MTDVALSRFLEMIAATEVEEISCSECFDLLSRHVDLEIAGYGIDSQWARLQQHLHQCGVCRDEYETLKDLVRLDSDGRSVVPDPFS